MQKKSTAMQNTSPSKHRVRKITPVRPRCPLRNQKANKNASGGLHRLYLAGSLLIIVCSAGSNYSEASADVRNVPAGSGAPLFFTSIATIPLPVCGTPDSLFERTRPYSEKKEVNNLYTSLNAR